ncbi:MAG: transposase [Bacteroidota bacterium]
MSLLLPEGLLEYFDLVKVEKEKEDLSLYLEEKNMAPTGYENIKLESKGFFEQAAVQDFPIRHYRVMLYIKRRRWQVIETGEIVKRDWDLVQKGTRITKEFGAFLKGILG